MIVCVHVRTSMYFMERAALNPGWVLPIVHVAPKCTVCLFVLFDW